MRPKTGWLIFTVASLLALGVGAWAGRGISYAGQVQLLRELRDVSTIVFGITGAWLAIIYPEELRRKLRPTEAVAVDPATLERFRGVMRCIVASAVIVGVVLAIQFAAVIVGQIAWARHYHVVLRAACFALCCQLAVAQIWVVLLVLVPLNAADADVRHIQETQQMLNFGPQGKKGIPKR